MPWYEVTGTISDMVMAAAAVYAASKADDFFRAKKNEAALKAAITLYDFELPKLHNKNKDFIRIIEKLEWRLNHNYDRMKPSSESYNIFHELTSQTDYLQTTFDVMHDCYRNIASSRIDFKIKESGDFVKILGSTTVLIAQYMSFKNLYKEIVILDKAINENNSSESKTSRESQLKEFANKLEEIKETHIKLREMIKPYGNPSITADEHFRKKRFFEK